MHPLIEFKYCPICASPNFLINNELSKKCGDCGFTYYHNPRAATVAVIVNEVGEIFVCRRAKEPAKGTLDLPGGFVDLNESAEQGVAREVMEELGLEVKGVKYLFSKPNIYPYSGIIIDTMDLFFLCKVDTSKPILAMDDVAEVIKVKLQDLNPDDFGLRSIREGLRELKTCNINYLSF